MHPGCGERYASVEWEEEVMRKFDRDGDRTISPREFLTLLPLYCERTGWSRKHHRA